MSPHGIIALLHLARVLVAGHVKDPSQSTSCYISFAKPGLDFLASYYLADCPAVSLDLCIYTNEYPNVKQLSWAINYILPRVQLVRLRVNKEERSSGWEMF